MLKSKYEFIWTILIGITGFLLATIFPFKQHFKIELAANKASMFSQDSVIEKEIKFDSFSSLSISMQRSLINNPGIKSISVKCSNTESDYEKDFGPYLFIFGRDLLSNVQHGEYKNFIQTFGDWTMDRARSERLPIFTAECRLPAKVIIELVGRGESNLYFRSADGMDLINGGISAGFIDNSAALCDKDGCASSAVNGSIATNLLRILGLFGELIFIAAAITFILLFIGNPKSNKLIICSPSLVNITLGSFAVFHFITCYYFQSKILGGIPHIPDSSTYFRQGILLMHGLLQAPLPPEMPYEAFLTNSGHLKEDGILYVHANHFWPVIIGIFWKLGIPELLGPILSLICFFTIFLLGKSFISDAVGLVAACIFAISPFTVINSGDYMMHMATATFFWLGCLCIFCALEKKSKVFAIIAGVLLTYAFTMRQLTVLALCLPLFIILLSKYNFKSLLSTAAFVLVGAFPILIVFFAENNLIAGGYFKSIHNTIHGLTISFDNLKFGLANTSSMLSYLLPMLWYFPLLPQLSFSLCFIGLLQGVTKIRIILFTFVLSLIAVHALLNTNAMHGYGSRLYFEAMPAICLLVAEGFVSAFSLLSRLARYLMLVLASIFIFINVSGLIEILPMYKGYNGIKSTVLEQVKELGIDDSIILVKEHGWQSMDLFTSIYDPYQQSPMLIKKMPDGSENNIIKKFPDKKLILVDYSTIEEIKR